MAGAGAFAAGSALFLWALLRGEPLPRAGEWRAAARAGFWLLLLGNGGVVWSERVLPSSFVTLVLATEPAWFVVFDWLFFRGPRPRWLLWAGVSLGFFGVLLLIVEGLHSAQAPGWPAATAAVLGAALAWSYGSLVTRDDPAPRSAAMAAALPVLAGGAMLAAAGLAAGEFSDLDITRVSGRSWAGFAYITVISYGFAYVSYLWLLRHVPVARVSTYAYVNPAIAVFLGYAVGGERLGPAAWAGAAVILAAVFWITAASGDAALTPKTKAGT